MRFEDARVLVTGATGGIGGAVARRFASEGARVVAHTHRREDEARELVDAVDGDGHAVGVADLMAPEGREALVEAAVDRLGGLDVLVNNAGRFVEHDPEEVSLTRWREAWERTLALNLRAPADLSFLAADRMRAEGGGAIVNVSSRGAFHGEPTAPAYGASKAGLNALTGSLAKRLGEHGVRVAAVAPGFVDTPMVEAVLEGPRGDAIREESALDRVARPEEIAAAVAFLASEECPIATGAILDANGASHLRS
jgi:NAD(P)-dependent dehydrogenase (short-subunit alcohol dehydrogenase family)